MAARARKRMTKDQRRDRILDEASRIFATKGLHGATTREIAKASGISEPVLYQHFKGKAEIYEALELMCSLQTAYFRQILRDQGPSIDSLITITYLLIRVISYCKEPGTKTNPRESGPAEILLRLMGHSFLDNGSFANALVENCIGAFFDQWHESYKKALADGHLTISKAEALPLWLAYESIIGFGMFVLPNRRLIDKIRSTDEVSKTATLFVLRGLGVRERVLETRIHWTKLRQVYLKATSSQP